MQIKNIIFDLGGILLNLDYNATMKGFHDLGVTNFDEFFTQAKQNHLFDRLDTGNISITTFRDELRKLSGINMTDQEIDAAWNAMILDFPAKRINMLSEVKQHYKTFLFSNTNAIHYPYYNRILQENFNYDSLSPFFIKEYYSHLLKMRKPDVASFQYIINENNLTAQHTLFIDDTEQHIEGARKAGLQVRWLDKKREEVTDLFEKGRLKQEILESIFA